MKELQELLKKYETEREQLNAKCLPLRTRREQLTAKLAPLEAELRTLNNELKALTQPSLGELEQVIRGLRLTLGFDKPPVVQLSAEAGQHR